jgi:hypothetical protein
MTPVELELTISVGERPQTYFLGRAATGTGVDVINLSKPTDHVMHHQV